MAILYIKVNSVWRAVDPQGIYPDISSTGLPSTPTSIATAKDDTLGRATISWQPPESTGGLEITSYFVGRDGVDTGGTGAWSTMVSADTRAYTFHSLVIGNAYNLTVYAVNANGNGASAVATVQIGQSTVGAPSVPTSVVLSKDDTVQSATIAWQPPSNDGGSMVTGYFVGRDGVDKNGGGAWSTIVEPSLRSFTFLDLVGGNTYTLTVYAINANGNGSPAGGLITIGSDSTAPQPGTPASFIFTNAPEFTTAITSGPVLDANSSSLVNRIASSGNKVLHTYAYTNPIYYADAATPRYSVAAGTLRVFHDDPGGPNDWGAYDISSANVPIPNDAIAAPGTDGWMAIVDEAGGYVYNLWISEKTSYGWMCRAGGRYLINGNGLSTTTAYATDSQAQAMVNLGADLKHVHLWRNPLTQGTAAGVSIAAGVIMASEVDAGVIPHALAFSTDIGAGPRRAGPYRWPATSTDAHNSPYDPRQHLVYGMRLQLDPAYDTSAITDRVQRMIAVALQKYGMYVVDMGGSRVGLSGELANTQYKKDVYAANGLGQGDGYYGLSQIPWNQLRILKKWNGVA